VLALQHPHSMGLDGLSSLFYSLAAKALDPARQGRSSIINYFKKLHIGICLAQLDPGFTHIATFNNRIATFKNRIAIFKNVA